VGRSTATGGDATMIRTFSILTVLSTGLVPITGCGSTSVQPVSPARVHTDSRHVFEKNYSLGVERSAYVGESIVRVKDYFETLRESDTLVASEPFKLSIGFLGEHEDVAAGAIAEVRGVTTKDGKLYRVVGIKGAKYRAHTYLLNDDGSFQGKALGAGGASCHTTPPTARLLSKTVTEVDRSKGWTNLELVYSGVTKDSITVLYREYTPDDMARAAYSQNLVYSKESTTIRFRDISIKVIEASNERLRYVVQADGLK
jgi:hypothetical protein